MRGWSAEPAARGVRERVPVEVRVVSLSLSFSRGSLEGDWTDGGQMADG